MSWPDIRDLLCAMLVSTTIIIGLLNVVDGWLPLGIALLVVSAVDIALFKKRGWL